MILLLLLVVNALFDVVTCISQHPVLIVVSYDAFRYNYFEKNGSLYMDKLRKEGTYADYMLNVFPTKTFPNHHSIATGLYPESHGVVGNSFYDPKLKRVIKMSEEMWRFRDDIIPIWTLNEIRGAGRYSGSMMWPGAKYLYNNKNITYIQDWDIDADWYKRVDTIISWIKNPTKPANLVMLYFEEPDTHGHVYGPESDTVFNLLKRLDNITRYIDDQLLANDLADYVNVIHLSDHGMSSVSPPNFINITQFLKSNTYEIADTSPCLHIIPDSDFEQETYKNLRQASREHGNFSVYWKKDLPSKWHFKNNRRAPPIFVLADPGYAFQDLAEAAQTYALKYHINITPESQFGVHGYDNEDTDMHPFFMARGPKIKKQHKVSPFHTVDLYNLFCDILEIKPVANNGSSANIKAILVSQAERNHFTTLGIAVAVIVSLMLVSCGAAITLLVIKRQQNITTIAALNKRFPQTFNTNAGIEAQHLLESEEA
ncbi:bis(5'-adenosyl)-triphosphatase enpp4-like isoform X2 [Atheta coriaria]|uniref:bis(5'-adenosyl)-triphosphatase enpp4-like isoform X2 n=1 Tax=Dalotia coriaria TaxID=877792 RepID=UPI0031F3D043